MKLMEKLLEPPFALLWCDGECLEDAEDVLFDSEGAEDRGLLGEIAHPHARSFVDGKRGHLLGFEEHFACIGADQPDGHVKGGRLACAVGTEESDHFSFADMKREAVYDEFAAVRFLKVFCAQDRLCGRGSRPLLLCSHPFLILYAKGVEIDLWSRAHRIKYL